MTSTLERDNGLLEMFGFDQNEIGVESRDRKNSNVHFRQRLEHREQNSSQRKLEWTLKFQASPAKLEPQIARVHGHVCLETDDAQFVTGSSDGEELSLERPSGNRRFRIELNHRKTPLQQRQIQIRHDPSVPSRAWILTHHQLENHTENHR
jgi:hypothetical protein